MVSLRPVCSMNLAKKALAADFRVTTVPKWYWPETIHGGTEGIHMFALLVGPLLLAVVWPGR